MDTAGLRDVLESPMDGLPEIDVSGGNRSEHQRNEQDAEGDDAQNGRNNHPDGRDKAFRPNKLCRCRRKREHQIAFVSEQIFVKPHNHVDERQNADGKQRQDIGEQEERQRNRQPL